MKVHRLLVASSFLALGAAGCAPRLRAVPNEGQIAFDKSRGLIEARGDVTLSAVALGSPPLAAAREFTAFGVEVQNRGDAALFVDAGRMGLGRWDGAGWVDQAAVPPDELVRSYTPVARAFRAFAEITPPEPARYCGPPPCYRPVHAYPRHSVWVYGGSSCNDGAMEAYRRRQETASFLARLLRPQWVAKDHVAGGFVVFAQPVEKEMRYRLTIPAGVATAPIVATDLATATRPVAVRDQVFEFFFEGH